jgi:hypothetical protein
MQHRARYGFVIYLVLLSNSSCCMIATSCNVQLRGGKSVKNSTGSELDYKLAGQLIKDEQAQRFGTIAQFCAGLGIDRTTAHRLFTGAPNTKTPTLRAVERILGWPPFAIDAIRRQDFRWLEREQFPPHTLSRMQDLLAERTQVSRLDT